MENNIKNLITVIIVILIGYLTGILFSSFYTPDINDNQINHSLRISKESVIINKVNLKPEILEPPIDYPHVYPEEIPNSGFQIGVLQKYYKYGYFGLFKVGFWGLGNNEIFNLTLALKRFHPILYKYKIYGDVSIGKRLWKRIKKINKPYIGDVGKFLSYHGFGLPKKDTYDIYIHLAGYSQSDVIFASQEVFKEFTLHFIASSDEQFCFSIGDGRDLTGFKLYITNPDDMKERELLLQKNANMSTGNTYAFVQRFDYDLTAWNSLTETEQESIMGISKKDGTPIPSSNLNNHYSKINNTMNKILEQSMPYGLEGDEHRGLIFAAYSKTYSYFNDYAKSIFGEETNHPDSFLEYSKAMTGSYFFTPSLDIIQKLVLKVPRPVVFTTPNLKNDTKKPNLL